jgi:RNA polymerase sigma-70 factor, ECF subfamily
MATRSTVMLMDKTRFPGVLHQSHSICPQVWSDLYRDHHGYVLQVCRRFFPRPEDAEDAAAEVFLKLCRVLQQKDEKLPFRPWITRVAWHHCIDKLRRRKHEKRTSVEGLDLGFIADRTTPSPLCEILRKDQERQVRERLVRMPRKYKVPLLLRYYRRMSYSDIARVLNMRLATVRMLIFRAKNYLRRDLHHHTQSSARRALQWTA